MIDDRAGCRRDSRRGGRWATLLVASIAGACFVVASCGGDEFSGAETPDAGSGGGAGGQTDAASGGKAGAGGTGVQGGAAGAVTQGGAAGTVTQGGAAGTVTQGGAAGTVTQGGAAGTAADDAGDATALTPISGKVLDTYGLPVEGVLVRVGAEKATTAADGAFSLGIVSSPYDVELVATAGGKKFGYAFLQVSRLDPTLQLAGLPASQPMTAKVTGTVNYPEGGSQDGIAFLDYTDVVPSGANRDDLGPLSKTFLVPGAWYGKSLTTATAHVLTWTHGGDGFPNKYLGWTSQPVSVSNGEIKAAPDSSTGLAGADGTVGATVSVPDAAYTVNNKMVFVGVDGGRVLARFIHDTTANGAVTYKVPGQAGLRFAICATAKPVLSLFNTSTYCKSVGISETVALDPPLPPTAISPVGGQKDISLQTEFKWNAVPNAVYVLSLTNNAGPSFFVVTTNPQARIPDLSAMGAPLPSAHPLAYLVFAMAPASNMDAATGPKGFLQAVTAYADQRGPEEDGVAGISELASITTQ